MISKLIAAGAVIGICIVTIIACKTRQHMNKKNPSTSTGKKKKRKKIKKRINKPQGDVAGGGTDVAGSATTGTIGGIEQKSASQGKRKSSGIPDNVPLLENRTLYDLIRNKFQAQETHNFSINITHLISISKQKIPYSNEEDFNKNLDELKGLINDNVSHQYLGPTDWDGTVPYIYSKFVPTASIDSDCIVEIEVKKVITKPGKCLISKGKIQPLCGAGKYLGFSKKCLNLKTRTAVNDV
ncbi:unnamed protein product [Gordionus sp. m RMFG-2023]